VDTRRACVIKLLLNVSLEMRTILILKDTVKVYVE